MRSFGQAGEYVMQVIRDCGHHPSQSSRLAQMRNILRTGFIGETDPAFELACEALRDITLLQFAFDQLRGQVPEDALRERIERLVKDSPLPQNDQSATPGRDAQMELYAAAICQAAGLNPKFEEPDVVVDMDGHPYGLAVKRLKSLRQLEKRFREAARQVHGSGIPGFVVLEITIAVNPGNRKLAFPVNDDCFGDWARQRFARFMERCFDRFVVWRAGREVRGVILHYHQVCRSDLTGLWRLNSFNGFASLDPHDRRRYSEGNDFWSTYQRGTPNIVQ